MPLFPKKYEVKIEWMSCQGSSPHKPVLFRPYISFNKTRRPIYWKKHFSPRVTTPPCTCLNDWCLIWYFCSLSDRKIHYLAYGQHTCIYILHAWLIYTTGAGVVDWLIVCWLQSLSWLCSGCGWAAWCPRSRTCTGPPRRSSAFRNISSHTRQHKIFNPFFSN